MNIPPATTQCHPNAATPVFLPDELMGEILSLLTVKPLTRFRCVSKSLNTLISDPTFVKLHLNKSARNAHLALVRGSIHSDDEHRSVVLFPVSRLIENQTTIVIDDPYYRLKDKDCSSVVGSCNGLLCLHGCSFTAGYPEHWLCFWNPATRSRSEKLGYFCDFGYPLAGSFKFTFGHDDSTDTYKVVAFRLLNSEEHDEVSCTTEGRVFSLGVNSWRNIQSFPEVPIQCSHSLLNHGVCVSGAINWLAFRKEFVIDHYDWMDITVEQFMIVSLDLRTETYRKLLLPRGFDEVPLIGPNVGVLMDCLCFSHDVKGTDFVIWQMKEFGVVESWTPFIRIGYQNLPLDIDEIDNWEYYFQLLPLCLSENGDTLILASGEEDQAILYNWRDNRVERTRISSWMVYLFEFMLIHVFCSIILVIS